MAGGLVMITMDTGYYTSNSGFRPYFMRFHGISSRAIRSELYLSMLGDTVRDLEFESLLFMRYHIASFRVFLSDFE